jgi:transcriptional regulator with XRE-family HTH domain
MSILLLLAAALGGSLLTVTAQIAWRRMPRFRLVRTDRPTAAVPAREEKPARPEPEIDPERQAALDVAIKTITKQRQRPKTPRPRPPKAQPKPEPKPEPLHASPTPPFENGYVDAMVIANGKTIRRLRLLGGWTIHSIGKMFGHTGSWVEMIEAGRSRVRRHDLRLLARLFGVPVRDLIFEGKPADLEHLPRPAEDRLWVDGAILRAARNRAGISQEELAELVGTSANYISSMETMTRPAATEIVHATADTLGFFSEALIFDHRRGRQGGPPLVVKP